MNRRRFLKVLIAGGAGAVVKRSFGGNLTGLLTAAERRALPAPQVNTFSSEIVLNSRRSYHSGYGGSLTDQVLANILWAAARAPLIGATRIIYVARTDNVYRYDPVAHDIVLHLAGNHMSEANTAFEIGVASDIAEDAGAALHYGLLAAISFWTGTTSKPCCIPKESAYTNANNTWNPALPVQMVNCYGLMPTVSGITNQLVAVSSDSSLPDPSTDGPLLLENGLAALNYGDQFLSTELTIDEISQTAWASYGNTPHTAAGKGGLAVASAVANYYCTGRIYIVRSAGVERYHIRLPSGSQSTRDHRIERVTTGDRRPQLRSAVTRLPQTAPNYLVFCATTAARWQLLEAGFAGASALLQTTTLGLQGHAAANFSAAERTAIIGALSIPATDLPLVVFSTGQKLVGSEESGPGASGTHGFTVAPNPFVRQTAISYRQARRGRVRITVYDAGGRHLKTIVSAVHPRGLHTWSWNGRDYRGRAVPAGKYLVILECGEQTLRQRLTRTR